MLCKDLKDAAEQAQLKANRTGQPWRYFADTSGNARCEKVLPNEKAEDHTTWAGVTFTIVHPEKGVLSEEQLQRRYAASELFLIMMGCCRRGSKFLFDRFDPEFYILFDMAEDLDNRQSYGLIDVYLLRVGYTPMPGEHALRVLTDVGPSRVAGFLSGLGLDRFPPRTGTFLANHSVSATKPLEGEKCGPNETWAGSCRSDGVWKDQSGYRRTVGDQHRDREGSRPARIPQAGREQPGLGYRLVRQRPVSHGDRDLPDGAERRSPHAAGLSGRLGERRRRLA